MAEVAGSVVEDGLAEGGVAVELGHDVGVIGMGLGVANVEDALLVGEGWEGRVGRRLLCEILYNYTKSTKRIAYNAHASASTCSKNINGKQYLPDSTRHWTRPASRPPASRHRPS